MSVAVFRVIICLQRYSSTMRQVSAQGRNASKRASRRRRRWAACAPLRASGGAAADRSQPGRALTVAPQQRTAACTGAGAGARGSPATNLTYNHTWHRTAFDLQESFTFLCHSREESHRIPWQYSFSEH